MLGLCDCVSPRHTFGGMGLQVRILETFLNSEYFRTQSGNSWNQGGAEKKKGPETNTSSNIILGYQTIVLILLVRGSVVNTRIIVLVLQNDCWGRVNLLTTYRNAGLESLTFGAN